MLVHLVLALALVAGFVVADVAQAQSKVQMPKEGTFEFDFCFVGHATVPVATKEFTFGTYTNNASIRAASPGGPFDRQSARCWGAFANVGGKAKGSGFCEAVDQDGDKWYAEFHDNAEGTGGTYTALYGTGKYQGMVLNAEYRNNPWPATADAVLGCNPNKGTYKLAR